MINRAIILLIVHYFIIYDLNNLLKIKIMTDIHKRHIDDIPHKSCNYLNEKKNKIKKLITRMKWDCFIRLKISE